MFRELHALDITHGVVHLGMCRDFIGKNQLPGQPEQSFTIPLVSTIVGIEYEDELLLCPVRML